MGTEWCTRRCVPIKASSKSLHWRHCATFLLVKTQRSDIPTSHLPVRKYSKSKSGLCQLSLARCQESEPKWHRQTLMETFRVFFFGHWNYAALSHSVGSLSGISLCDVVLCNAVYNLCRPSGNTIWRSCSDGSCSDGFSSAPCTHVCLADRGCVELESGRGAAVLLEELPWLWENLSVRLILHVRLAGRSLKVDFKFT